MKPYYYAFIFAGLLLLISFTGFTAYASEEEEPDPVVIETYEEDVTGDGLKEVIELKGLLLSGDSNYYHKVWADVTSQHNKEWKISYEGGYDPELTFKDLSHDKVSEMIFQSATSGNGGLYNYRIHTLQNHKVSEIPLPVQRHVEGSFDDNFKAEIQISPDKNPHKINVKKKASEYVQLGIYDEKGKLEKPTSVMIDPISFFEPKLISKSKGIGLKSYQQISGAYHADQLGTIETLWYYEDDDWVILQTEWVPST